MNLLEIKDWIEFGASIGALISALIALAALFEIRKQRESSYQPDLYLSPISCKVKTKIHHEDNRWDFKYIFYNNNQKIKGLHVPYTLENIGNGAAKDVEIIWSFNFEKAINQLRKRLPKNFTHETYSSFFDIINEKNESVLMLNNELLSEETIYDFVLPRKDEVFEKAPSIPYEISNLYVSYFLLKNNFFKDYLPSYIEHEEYKEMPDIQAKLTYFDIGGKKFQKIFKIAISISAFKDELKEMREIQKFKLQLYVEAKMII